VSFAASCLVPTQLASCISCHRSFFHMLVNSSIRGLLHCFGLQIYFCARMDLSLRARRKTGSNPTSFFQQGTGRQRVNTSTVSSCSVYSPLLIYFFLRFCFTLHPAVFDNCELSPVLQSIICKHVNLTAENYSLVHVFICSAIKVYDLGGRQNVGACASTLIIYFLL
jgi:hypothetical protein